VPFTGIFSAAFKDGQRSKCSYADPFPKLCRKAYIPYRIR
jgi:hypothetical protein